MEKNQSFKLATVIPDSLLVGPVLRPPLAHLFVFLLHFTLTSTPGLGLWHCVCVRWCLRRVCVVGYMFLSLSLVKSNLPGWAHKSRLGVGCENGDEDRFRVCAAIVRLSLYPSFIPVDIGGVAIACRSCICFCLTSMLASLSVTWPIALVSFLDGLPFPPPLLHTLGF